MNTEIIGLSDLDKNMICSMWKQRADDEEAYSDSIIQKKINIESWGRLSTIFNGVYYFEHVDSCRENTFAFLADLAATRADMLEDEVFAEKYFNEQAATERTISCEPF